MIGSDGFRLSMKSFSKLQTAVLLSGTPHSFTSLSLLLVSDHLWWTCSRKTILLTPNSHFSFLNVIPESLALCRTLCRVCHDASCFFCWSGYHLWFKQYGISPNIFYIASSKESWDNFAPNMSLVDLMFSHRVLNVAISQLSEGIPDSCLVWRILCICEICVWCTKSLLDSGL